MFISYWGFTNIVWHLEKKEHFMHYENEILFSVEELNAIEDFVGKNPQFRDPMLMNIAKAPVDIVKVSQKLGLIIAKGNEYTGFEHIHQRHEQWTSTPKWIESKNDDGNIKWRLQKQGLFRKDSIPFFDYCIIAESVYKAENLNIEKNKRLDLFEMYIGEYIHKDNTNAKYILLVYKGTKVIHTLYPQSNKNNPFRVKRFNYTRGRITSNWDGFINSFITIRVPYLNHKEKVEYTLVFIKDLSKNQEIAIIQVNNNLGIPWKSVIIGERKIASNNNCSFFNQLELTRLQYADLREFEKCILEIERENEYNTTQQNL